MAILYGQYDCQIDPKNRLVIPAEIRRAIDPAKDGESFFMIEGQNGVPWLYPIRWYEAMVAEEESDLTPEDDLLDFDHMIYGTGNQLDFDKQWRVLIPEKTLRRLNLDHAITLVGSRDHLELWNRPAWSDHLEVLKARRAEILLKRRQRHQARVAQRTRESSAVG